MGSTVVDGSGIGVGASSVQPTIKLVVTSINADRGGNLKASHHKSSKNCVVNHLKKLKTVYFMIGSAVHQLKERVNDDRGP